MLSILQGNGCIFNVLLSISYFTGIEKENNSFEYLCFFINRKNFLETESSMAENRGNFERYFIPMHALGRHFQLGGLYDYRTDTILTGKYFILYCFCVFCLTSRSHKNACKDICVVLLECYTVLHVC